MDDYRTGLANHYFYRKTFTIQLEYLFDFFVFCFLKQSVSAVAWIWKDVSKKIWLVLTSIMLSPV